ncbi:MAG: NYN domain-containing protein [Phycisphaerales bacterium]
MAAKKNHKQKKRETAMSLTPPKAPMQRARKGLAKDHGELANQNVHVFVDDQNLFYGATNHYMDRSFRVDFGRLLSIASNDAKEQTRGVLSAYIAGVIPDDDSFWNIAEKEGFIVKRGFMGQGNRSKQDDAHLITAIMETIYEQESPSTIVLVAGDADYSPPLTKAIEKGWRVEVCFHNIGLSRALESVSHEIRSLTPSDYGLMVDKKGFKMR